MTKLPSRTGPALISTAVLAAIAVLLTMVIAGRNHATPPPPMIDLTDVESTVAEGLTDARQAVLDSPGSADSWSQLGMTFDAHEYTAEALACYQMAARLDQQDPRWPYLSGTLLYATDRKAARQAFQQAIDLSPRSPLYHIRLAEVCLDSADLTEAEKHLTAALKLEPSSPRGQFRLAQLRLLQTSPESALQHAESALALRPNHQAILRLLITIHGRLGRQSSPAARRYQEQLRGTEKPVSGWADPTRSQIQLFRLDSWWLASQGETRLELGDVEGSVTLLRKAVEEAPSNAVFRARLANAFLRSARLDEAQQVIAETPPQQRGQFDILRISATLGLLSEDWTTARSALEAALRQKPDDSFLLTDLGFVLRQQGLLDEAIVRFERSATLNPKSSENWKQLVETLVASGDRQAARLAIAKALEFLPDNPELHSLELTVSAGTDVSRERRREPGQ